MTQPHVLAIIPARAGSQRLPGKNLRPLRGKPLLAWTIEAALNARTITRTVVSTEDEAIAACARMYGAEVPVMRPAALAEDDTPGMLPILHLVDWLRDHAQFEPHIIVVLQPTSPLRTAADIDVAIGQMQTQQATCVTSVSPIADASWLRTIAGSGRLKRAMDGDDRVYVLNGAIYAAQAEVVRATRSMDDGSALPYVMPRERSVDIDVAADFELAEFLMGRRA